MTINKALQEEMKTGSKPLTGCEGFKEFSDDFHISNIQRIKDLEKIISRDGFSDQFSINFLTSNPNKILQFNKMVNNPSNFVQERLSSIITLQPSLIEDIDAPEELSESFVENSTEKARYYAKETNQTVLSEDSGFIIPFTDFNPGVVSARFHETELGSKFLKYTMDAIQEVFSPKIVSDIKSNVNVHFLNNLATIGMVASKMKEVKADENYQFGYRSCSWGNDNFVNTGLLAYFITSAAIAEPDGTVTESCGILKGTFETYIIENIFGIDHPYLRGNEEVMIRFLESSSHKFGYNPLLSIDRPNKKVSIDDMFTQHRRNAINGTIIKYVEKHAILDKSPLL
ncbi:non-canonical purine NTP pyrophosphatase [Proteus mirabilis]|uniref:non-canonical purine NTP pyrophosphatase n=1 Tax=Proteus mirabilis TaxID=584 RepID=UPI0034D57A1F